MSNHLRAMLSATLEDVVTSDLNEVQDATMSDDIIVAEEQAEAEKELRMTEEAIEVAEETAENLEEIVAKMEEAAEEGGLSEDAAAFMHLSLNMALKPFGGAEAVIPEMPGVEAFGDAGQRGAALQAGVESIKDKAKDVWQTIKKFIVDLYNKVAKFLSSIFTTAGRLEKAFAKLKEAKLEGVAQEDKIKLKASTVAKLSVDGKLVEEPTKVAAMMTVQINTLRNSGKVAAAYTEYSKKVLEAHKTDGKISADDLLEVLGDTLGDVAAAYGAEEGVSDVKRWNTPTVGRSKELPGGVAVFCPVKLNGANLSMTPTLAPVDPKAKYQDEEVAPMTIKEIKDAASFGLGIVKSLRSTEGSDKALKKMAEDIAKNYDEIANILKGKDGVQISTRLKSRAQMYNLRRIASNGHKVMGQLSAHAISVAGALYTFALASKNNLGAEKKA